MQHNAVLLLGQLARASLAFRRRFAAHVAGMEALVGVMDCDDAQTKGNALWALRNLVDEGAHRDMAVRKRTQAKLKALALMASPDSIVATNAKALNDILRRPIPINTVTADDEAAAGLASILHTPPPSEAPRVQRMEETADSRRAPKRKSPPQPQETRRGQQGERTSKRLANRRSSVFADEESDDAANDTPDEGQVDDAGHASALAFLIQAAEG